MDKSLTGNGEDSFWMESVDPGSYSPLELAFLGDGVYDLMLRVMVMKDGSQPVENLHREKARFARASAQSRMMRYMQSSLTGEEHAVYKHARNVKSVSAAKNSSVVDYRRATGFEALIGYLYLKREYDRLEELVQIGLDGLLSETAAEEDGDAGKNKKGAEE